MNSAPHHTSLHPRTVTDVPARVLMRASELAQPRTCMIVFIASTGIKKMRNSPADAEAAPVFSQMGMLAVASASFRRASTPGRHQQEGRWGKGRGRGGRALQDETHKGGGVGGRGCGTQEGGLSVGEGGGSCLACSPPCSPLADHSEQSQGQATPF